MKIPRQFKLGTTSFIYPDNIIPNVRKIGEFFDEIELLVFESLPEEVLPSIDDVGELASLGRDLNLTYNVHLPVDISLTAEPRDRQQAADILKRVLERFSPLAPTTCTLHMDMDKTGSHPDDLKAWEERAHDGLALLAPGLDDPSLISVETLWYDPEVLLPLVREFGLSLCADAGHHFKYGYDLNRTFDLFREKISIVHLHGVDTKIFPPKDHIGLNKLSDFHFDMVTHILTGFTGTVSLEVFNRVNLDACLERMAEVFTGVRS